MPVGPARALISFIEKKSNAIGLKPPITRAIIDKYTEDVAVDGSRIRTELGFKPQYDLRSGWQETVQEMRRMGESPLRLPILKAGACSGLILKRTRR